MIKEYTHQNEKMILTWNASDNRALKYTRQKLKEINLIVTVGVLNILLFNIIFLSEKKQLY